MSIIKDFKPAVKECRKRFNDLKNSMDPFAAYYNAKVVNSLPFNFPQLILDFITQKFTCVITNLCAHKVDYTMNGVK